MTTNPVTAAVLVGLSIGTKPMLSAFDRAQRAMSNEARLIRVERAEKLAAKAATQARKAAAKAIDPNAANWASKAIEFLSSPKLPKAPAEAVARVLRHYTNESRATLIDRNLQQVRQFGLTEQDAKALGGFIMSATGRGTAKSLDKIMPGANVVLLAARYYLAAVQILSLQPIWGRKSSTLVRMEIAKSYTKAATGFGTVVALVIMAFGFADPEDPESPGFVWDRYSPDHFMLRLKNGAKIDIFGPFRSFFNFGSRMLVVRAMRDKNRPTRINPMSAQDIKRDRENFIAGRKNLMLRLAQETNEGEHYGSKPVTVSSFIDQATTMIMFEQVHDIYENQGPAAGTLLSSLLFLGANVQTPKTEEDLEKTRELKAQSRERRLDRRNELNQ